MTPEEKQAFDFASELLGLAIDIVGASSVEVDLNSARDPKVVGLTLLCRTITNFRGALTMARDDQPVESRALVRLCFENLFLVAALCERGADFVRDMRSDEAANRKAIGELSLKVSSPEARADKSAQIIRTQIRALLAEFPKPKKFSVKNVADEGVTSRSYLSYAVLSMDAGHASVTALRRHSKWEKEGDKHFLTMTVAPPFKPTERLATIDEACSALLGVSVGVNQLLEGTSQSDAIRAFAERFETQGHHAYRR
ncbi:DUF5677 domain-containing protein [Methylocapsa sp. S129]|uniref:DUF5677 domain-containing protein n=1 Tax=Methylocapsa sp. S129 TaxID=1641869 RepID=UPI00131B0A01|nr:DUF5677 domain-containing protein [Methylocapsa sp. S129]